MKEKREEEGEERREERKKRERKEDVRITSGLQLGNPLNANSPEGLS